MGLGGTVGCAGSGCARLRWTAQTGGRPAIGECVDVRRRTNSVSVRVPVGALRPECADQALAVSSHAARSGSLLAALQPFPTQAYSQQRPADGIVSRRAGQVRRQAAHRAVRVELRQREFGAKGRLHGLVEGWHTNGVLQVREHFEDGVSHGLRSKFFPDGKPLSETPIVHGQVRGTFRRWHDNGRLAEEIAMEDGQPHGTSRAYYPSGTLKAEARTDHGKVLEHRVWKEGEAPADLAASAR